jgi:predicted Rossmann-fold nucleotide-binding protein
LVKWLKDTVLPDGKISASDIDLLRIVDTPEDVVNIVKATTSRGTDHDHQIDIELASLADVAKAYAPPPFAEQ